MSPAINQAMFGRLVEDLGGDRATVADIIGAFLKEAPTNLADLKAATARKDLETARRAAHTLKSTAMQMGAATVSDKAKEIELAAKEGKLPDASSLAQLEALWAAAQVELQQQKAKMAAA